MEFQLGALPHFKTEDQSKHGEFVRVLGLGGSTFYDWSTDSRGPLLKGCETDYVTFDGGFNATRVVVLWGTSPY
jgi:hypothetical protein